MGDGYAYGPLSAVSFKVDPSVHWIQARKAWDDDTNWVEGTLATFEDGTAFVALRPLIAVPTAEDSDQASSELVRGIFNIEVLPIDDPGCGETVWVNERWGVLAFADPEGNAIAIRQSTEMPESVFTQAGTRRLRFVSIQRSGDAEHIRGVLAYAFPRGHDDVNRFQIAPLKDIRYTVDVIAILNTCSTWGEVRAMATASAVASSNASNTCRRVSSSPNAQTYKLFWRNLAVFPPPVLDIEGNFFSLQREPTPRCSTLAFSTASQQASTRRSRTPCTTAVCRLLSGTSSPCRTRRCSTARSPRSLQGPALPSSLRWRTVGGCV